MKIFANSPNSQRDAAWVENSFTRADWMQTSMMRKSFPPAGLPLSNRRKLTHSLKGGIIAHGGFPGAAF
jgi:hypothetical protein